MNGINIWMQMLGFERNDCDKGAERFLKQTGFVPDSICALLFHSDFVHLHKGMDTEYSLFPDNCAYYAIPRNTERERQDWSNYDLRRLIAELKKKGVEFYAGIMGSYLNDLFHKEWLSDHPELLCLGRTGVGHLNCLKRFADGAYYEDFFAEKLVQTLTDYDCAGVHLADLFCPISTCYDSDYSADLCDQFAAHTGYAFPETILAEMNRSDTEAVNRRADYIWEHCREAWLRFHEWRWEAFFRKICSRVHAVGKKVSVLGMYCTDPFETEYLYGFNSAKIMEAGVDRMTANILPSSVAATAPYPLEYYYHRYHMDTPLLKAQVGNHSVLSMLGVQDASEEWNIMLHAPMKMERDLFTMTSFLQSNGSRALDGVLICLGDGIAHKDWDYLQSRIRTALDYDAEKPLSPLIFWSDRAEEAFLPAYIQTRRTSVHKQSLEIFKRGTPFGGAVRAEELKNDTGIVFVPNFDLLSEAEQTTVLHSGVPFLLTVPTDYALPEQSAQFVCKDAFSDYPLAAYIGNFTPSKELSAKILQWNRSDDGKPQLSDHPSDNVDPLTAELPYQKVGDGFLRSCAELLKEATASLSGLRCSVPSLSVRLKNGNIRLYLFNFDDNLYSHAEVQSTLPVAEAKIVTPYPVLPVKFIQDTESGFAHRYDTAVPRLRFKTKIAPSGVTILEIER